MANDNNKTSLSQTKSIEELADFWDEHDLTEIEDQTQEVEMTFAVERRAHYIAIDPDLLMSLRQTAEARGLSTESLVNLWLQERLLVQPR